MRKYSGLDPTDPLGQGMLKLHFGINSWLYISRKLQKIEGQKDKSPEELLREAQKVCVTRDEETNRRLRLCCLHSNKPLGLRESETPKDVKGNTEVDRLKREKEEKTNVLMWQDKTL